MRSLLLVLALLTAAAPLAAEPASVLLTLVNTGERTLRCQIIFGHWVTGNLPLMAPDQEVGVAVQRDPATREVFVPRESDGRPLMIEEILCGADDDWGATLAHVDLEAVKLSDAESFLLHCEAGMRVDCGPWQTR